MEHFTAKIEKMRLKLKINTRIFAYIKRNAYLCNVIKK